MRLRKRFTKGTYWKHAIHQTPDHSTQRRQPEQLELHSELRYDKSRELRLSQRVLRSRQTSVG